MTPQELDAIRARDAEVDRLERFADGPDIARAVAAERARIGETIGRIDWTGCGGWGCTDNMADVFRQVYEAIDREGEK